MNTNTALSKSRRRGMAEGLSFVSEAAEAARRMDDGDTEEMPYWAVAAGAAKLRLLKHAGQEGGGAVQAGKGANGRRSSINAGSLSAWAAIADEAIAAGLMGAAARAAAMSLAGQIARLESRFEQYYKLGEEDGEAKKAQSTPEALEKMGRCEKQLAELKARFFEMTGLDRQYAAKAELTELQCRAAEQDGEVLVKLEGFGEVPVQEE